MPCCLRDHTNSQQAHCAGVVASTRPGKVFLTYIAGRVCHVAAHTYHSVVQYKHAPVQQAEHCELVQKISCQVLACIATAMTYPIGTSCRANAISACMKQTDQPSAGLALGIRELSLPDARHGAYVAHETQESCACYFGLLQFGRKHIHIRRRMHTSIARHAVPVWRLTSTCCD